MKMGFLNYLTGWRKLGIKRGDLVLEVGSGGNPLIRSDVLCDKYILDDFERALGNVSIPIIMDRPFVCGDAEFLPFRDNSFDFLVSFHMMEHLENPDLFLEEAQRVAPQGYIVTPNSNCESLFGSYKHRWLIDVSEDNEILLKNKSNAGGMLNGFFHQLYKKNADFRTFWHRNSHVFEARFRWQRPIIYSLENDLAAQPAEQEWFTKATLKSESSASELDELPLKTRSWSTVKQTLRKIARPYLGYRDVDLTSLVTCPFCRGSIKIESERNIRCNRCKRKYPFLNGTMFLIRELASNP